jgi:SAM-dependent methyltransferase
MSLPPRYFGDFDSKRLRKEYFCRKFPLDDELTEIVDKEQAGENKKQKESHDFLKNPRMQNVHIYLVEYLIAFSEKWFRTRNIKILDWGCGKGQVTYLCKKRNIDTVSCDIESDHADSAYGQYTPIAEHAKINVVPLKHPNKLPFDDKTFDVVLSFGVLEHVPNDAESLKEINRILKPHGLFFCFFLPYKYSYKQHKHHLQGDFYNDHLYGKKTVQKLVEQADLEVIDYWLRDLLPITPFLKNDKLKAHYRFFERIDNWFCRHTIIKHLASNIEFVAHKKD